MPANVPLCQSRLLSAAAWGFVSCRPVGGDGRMTSKIPHRRSASRVSIGVRRAPDVTTSDMKTARLLAAYVQMAAERWDEITAGRWRLYLAVAVPSPAITQLREHRNPDETVTWPTVDWPVERLGCLNLHPGRPRHGA